MPFAELNRPMAMARAADDRLTARLPADGLLDLHALPAFAERPLTTYRPPHG